MMTASWAGLGFLQQRAGALGIGLLGGKAVAAINMEEELSQPKGLDDCP